MDTNFEKILRLVFKSEELSPNDKLSRQIKSIQNDELSQEELEFVSAAAGTPHYNKFKASYVNNEVNKNG